MNMSKLLVRHVGICLEPEAGIPATPGTVSDLEGKMYVVLLVFFFFLNSKISTNIFRLLFIEEIKFCDSVQLKIPLLAG